MVHLDGARAVRVDLLLGHRFDLGLLRILRERVVQQRSRRVERLLEELLVVLLRDDRRAFGDQRRQPAGVIGVRMRVHHVADWLVGNQLLRFGDVGERTRLGLSGLEHHDVVPELDDQRIVAAGSGGEPVEPVAELFVSDGQRGRAAGGSRTGRRGQRAQPPRPRRAVQVRAPASRHRQDSPSPPSTSTSKNGQPPRVCTIFAGAIDAAEVLPARVGGEDVHVAHDVVAQPRLDPLDEVLVVHVAVDDVVLAGRRLDRRDSRSGRCSSCRRPCGGSRWRCSRPRPSGSPRA